jgi:L-amino acid N-acyltransferase YncA
MIITIAASERVHMGAVQQIYAHHVQAGTASFEEVPPDIQALEERRAAVLAANLPYLVALAEDMVVGYAYATHYRSRSAYRFTVEDSVYIHPDYTGRGIGRLLLTEVIAACRLAGMKQMVAIIGGGAENSASVMLHQRLGFVPVGVLEKVGYKFGRWVDSMVMQRGLEQQE